MQQTNLWLPGDKWKRDKWGGWDEYMHTTIHKVDN